MDELCQSAMAGERGPLGGMAGFYSRRLYRIALWMHGDVSSVSSSNSDLDLFYLISSFVVMLLVEGSSISSARLYHC